MDTNKYGTGESQTQPRRKRKSGPSWRGRVTRSFHTHVDWKNHPAEKLPEKQRKGSHPPFGCDSGGARNISQPKVKEHGSDGHAEEHHGRSAIGLMLCNDKQQRESNNQHALFMGKHCTKSGKTIASKIFQRGKRQVSFCEHHPKQQEKSGQAGGATGDPCDGLRVNRKTYPN